MLEDKPKIHVICKVICALHSKHHGQICDVNHGDLMRWQSSHCCFRKCVLFFFPVSFHYMNLHKRPFTTGSALHGHAALGCDTALSHVRPGSLCPPHPERPSRRHDVHMAARKVTMVWECSVLSYVQYDMSRNYIYTVTDWPDPFALVGHLERPRRLSPLSLNFLSSVFHGSHTDPYFLRSCVNSARCSFCGEGTKSR